MNSHVHVKRDPLLLIGCVYGHYLHEGILARNPTQIGLGSLSAQGFPYTSPKDH